MPGCRTPKPGAIPMDRARRLTEPLGSDGMWTRHEPGTPARGGSGAPPGGPWLARQTPAGGPRHASPAMTIAMLGEPWRGLGQGHPLYRRAAPGHRHGGPQHHARSNRAHDHGRPLGAFRLFPRLRDDLRLSAFYDPCFGHSRELWFFGLLRTFLNGWTDSPKRVGMFVAVTAQATTAAAAGPRWRCPLVRDDSYRRPTQARGPPRGPHLGTACCCEGAAHAAPRCRADLDDADDGAPCTQRPGRQNQPSSRCPPHPYPQKASSEPSPWTDDA